MTTDEHDIFHSEPAPGAIERDWTRRDLFITCTSMNSYYTLREAKAIGVPVYKLNVKRDRFANYVKGIIQLPICKEKKVK